MSSISVTTSVRGLLLSLDDIKDKDVKALLEEYDIDEIMVDVEDIDVDVDLDDFDEDDIIEHLEDQGYDVIAKDSHTHAWTGTSSFDTSMDHIEQIKDLLHLHCYDSAFLRLMLEEITMMPMGSSVDSVLAKLKEMLA